MIGGYDLIMQKVEQHVGDTEAYLQEKGFEVLRIDYFVDVWYYQMYYKIDVKLCDDYVFLIEVNGMNVDCILYDNVGFVLGRGMLGEMLDIWRNLI